MTCRVWVDLLRSNIDFPSLEVHPTCSRLLTFDKDADVPCGWEGNECISMLTTSHRGIEPVSDELLPKVSECGYARFRESEQSWSDKHVQQSVVVEEMVS